MNCSRCSDTFHYFCVGLNEASFKKMLPMNKAKWKCPVCKGTSATPNETPFAVFQKYLDDKLDPLTEYIRKDLAQELIVIREKVSQFDEIKKSLEFLSAEYDRINKKMEQNQRDMQKIQTDNDALLEKNRLLEHRINVMELRQRRNNIEIQQIPEKRTEDVLGIAKKIGEVVGFPLKNEDILACHRVQHQNKVANRPRNIVVELPNARYRDQLLLSVKTFNRTHGTDKLNTKHIGYDNREPIFISEHLSPYYKTLHAKTRLVAKEKGIKYVWVQNGKILTRKNDNAPIIDIKDLNSLDRL